MERRSTGRERDDDRGSRRSSRDDDERPSRRGRDDDERGGGRSRGGFEYQKRDAAEVKRRSQGGGDFDKYLVDTVKMFKPNDGDNTIRILPPTWKGAKHYGLDVYVHYGVGPDRQTYLCPSKMKGEKCPICEERERAADDGDEKYAKELKPRQRVLVYLIDRDHEKEGLQAWAMPASVDQSISVVGVDKKSGEVLPIDHPEDGFDIEFTKKGQKDRTEYIGVAIARRESSLGKDQWLDEATDLPLPETLIYYDYNHIAKAFGSQHGARRDDDDDDREHHGRSTRGADEDRGSRRGRDEDDRGSRRRSSLEEEAEPRRTARGRDEEPERSSRRRDDDDDRGSRRGKSDDPEYTWDQVHEMTTSELDALCDENDALSRVKPDSFDSDEELADEICKKLGIEKKQARRSARDEEPERGSRRRDEDAGESKLSEMRRRRESRD